MQFDAELLLLAMAPVFLACTHPARNPRYIDRNDSGVLVVWDRLVGSYVDEDALEAPEYGFAATEPAARLRKSDTPAHRASRET
jgi:sterol desaturase/sphingolipid hydroxylase (fatty acid hydroxylase superfamily)